MDNVTMAKINLFAVLRNLEDLCELDAESKKIAEKLNIAVEFNVKEVGSAVIAFKDGKCTFTRGKGKASLRLYFTSPEHFNKLINGENTIPIFYNVFKVGFLLKEFTQLTDRLSYFLQPPKEKLAEYLKDRTYFEINTTLTAYTAFFAMAEIANYDYVGKACAARVIPGTILCCIGETGPAINFTVKDHKFVAAKGQLKAPTARMCFSTIDFAHKILNGQASSFGGMGSGDFAVTGALDMLEQVAKLLNVVSEYLA
ncbi:MAG: hypothetical protein MJ068_04455 [Clostridia bacterium]|nr:hypothetical protein [Clostridia bacterium]